MSPHPLLACPLLSLLGARAYQPQSPADLTQLLATVHGADGANLVSALVEVFDHLAETLYQAPELGGADRASAASWLLAASQHLGAVADALDHARADLETAVTR